MGCMNELEILIQCKAGDEDDRYQELLTEINDHIHGTRLIGDLSQEAQEIMAEWEDRQVNTVLRSIVHK